jgi:hypothetical protein
MKTPEEMFFDQMRFIIRSSNIFDNLSKDFKLAITSAKSITMPGLVKVKLIKYHIPVGNNLSVDFWAGRYQSKNPSYEDYVFVKETPKKHILVRIFQEK